MKICIYCIRDGKCDLGAPVEECMKFEYSHCVESANIKSFEKKPSYTKGKTCSIK